MTQTGDIKPALACVLPVPVLIADKNSAVLDSIASVLRTSIPGIALTLCHSYSYAVHSLTNGRYQVVLCGTHFAEAGDFLLLKRHRAHQHAVPILLVAQRQDHDIVERALEEDDVEDIVVWPLFEEQLQGSVRKAMCLYQTRLTMAERQERLSLLRSRDLLPTKQRRLAIRRLEANVKDLARVVLDCEREARKRAIAHFDFLGRGVQELGSG